MQHIRGGDEDVRRVCAELFTAVSWRVAIVDGHGESGIETLYEGLKFVALILLQGFERKNVECMPLTVVQQGGQDRDVVHQCFSTRRRCGNDHVVAGKGSSDPFDLMGIQRRDGGRRGQSART